VGWRGGCTFLDPLIQAGFVIFARKGMAFVVLIRETLLSGVLVNVRRDMCACVGECATMMQLSQLLPTNLG
jgi:hypothetical protein